MSDKPVVSAGIFSRRSIQILSRSGCMGARIGACLVITECCRNAFLSLSTMTCGETRSEFGESWIADAIRAGSSFNWRRANQAEQVKLSTTFNMRRVFFLFAVCGFLMSNGGARAADEMNAVAERYARLVLALGQYDPDYVDAFYGPAEWKTQARQGWRVRSQH